MNRIRLSLLIFIASISIVQCIFGRVFNLQDSTKTDIVYPNTILNTINMAEQGDTLLCKGMNIRGNLDIVLASDKTIKCVLVFDNTKFIGSCNFNNCIFTNSVSFNHAVFLDTVTFDTAEIQKAADFSKCRFESHTEFILTKFLGKANFYEVKFNNLVNFDGSMFMSEDSALFNYTKFYGETSFHYIKAYKIRFWNAIFKENISFLGCKIKDFISFEGANFEKTVDLREFDLDNNAVFILQGMTFSLMRVGWNNIKSNIRISGKEEGIQKPKDYSDFNAITNIYNQLIDNFRKLGQYDDEDACYLELKQIQRSHLGGFRKIWSMIVNFTCGYGVKPMRTIFCSFLIILMFSTLFFMNGALKEKSKNNIQKKWFFRLKDAFYISTCAFARISYKGLYPSEERVNIPWFKIIKLKFKGKEIPFIGFKMGIPFSFRGLAVIEGIFGWLLMTLFIISFSRLWIR